MHETALELGRLFFDRYLPREGSLRILDIGSMNVNGSIRSVLPPDRDITYTGVDLEPGQGVDVVVDATSRLPFADDSFDAVVSTSCLEHDPQFWSTVDEAVRVCKPGGYVYLSTPSNGRFHSHPLDCWRFYPDAGCALEQWVNRGLPGDNRLVELIESAVFERNTAEWNDMIIVFGKRPLGFLPPPLSCLEDARNVRRHGREGVGRFEEFTEDQRVNVILGLSVRHLLSTLRADTDAHLNRGAPLLSIIVTYDQRVHDDAAFVRCIESTEDSDAEVIVVHDGPLVRALPNVQRAVIYHGRERARGVACARGLYLLHTDADGFYHPGALAELAGSLRAEPVGVLITHGDWAKVDGTTERWTGDPPEKGLLRNQIVLRRGLARSYGFPEHRADAEAALLSKITGEVGFSRSPIVLGRHR